MTTTTVADWFLYLFAMFLGSFVGYGFSQQLFPKKVRFKVDVDIHFVGNAPDNLDPQELGKLVTDAVMGTIAEEGERHG